MQIIKRTIDNSYVIEKNGMPYHVPNEGEFAEEWAEINAYAEAHPDEVTLEEPYVPTDEEIAEAERAAAEREANAVLASKSRANMVQTMSFTSSEFALLAKAELFPVWTVGETYPQGRRIQHDGIVYEVVVSAGVTAQEYQPPSGEGMLAVYRPLSVDPETGTESDGTQDNPYVYIYGMDVEKDSYYSYNDRLYKAEADMPACVWTPDTEGLWQWTEITETA
ncbi:hypothetical protein [Cloacibacillus sp. An23]|uniref:hypothetical protein n=1 Tax=Cloacibacillus sp. An23 TaxID=1965591 RepID=UPI000B376C3F|nr:hypothetical protein [Cloacibacillus sp. An23]OUO94742.1 hypothetical protein B5F39_02415 [Cloacibacillus sp. An23]